MKKMRRLVAAVMLSVCMVMPMSAFAAGTDTVYITGKGEKYHVRTCSTIQGRTVYSLTMDEAISKGKTACKVCFPGTSTTAAPAASSTQTASAVQTTPATVTTTTASTTASLTAEQAVQKAYGLYVQNGLDSNAAMSHVQGVLNKLAANPEGYAQIVSEDLKAATATATAAISSLTAEQAVQKAYALYVQNGLDSNSAMTHIQSILTQLAGTPDNYAQIVKDDLAKVTTSVASAASTGTNAEQLVQQMYAQLIGQGLTSDQAMAQINAQLPSILAGAAG